MIFQMIDLSPFPRVSLAHLPTPLQPLDRLSEYLNGPRIWIKRDDCTGLATGGNKTRKLEFLMGEAIEKGYEKVITFGAIQSNHVRQTVAAAASLGLSCEPILTKRVTYKGVHYHDSGNLLLDHILGAKTHIVANESEAVEKLKQLNSNHDYYVIPGGGSNATGALGYVNCVLELCQQFEEQSLDQVCLLHATSSGGTYAGLSAGFKAMEAAGLTHQVAGINVFDNGIQRLEETTRALCNEVCTKLQEVTGASLSLTEINIRHEYVGEDYGLPTKAMIEALRLVAELEGILLDPVYSGKGMAAMIDMIRKSEFDQHSTPVFLHTGGVAGLFAYGDTFE